MVFLPRSPEEPPAGGAGAHARASGHPGGGPLGDTAAKVRDSHGPPAAAPATDLQCPEGGEGNLKCSLPAPQNTGSGAAREALPPAGPWIDLARTSHYDVVEVRRRLGLSADHLKSLGPAPLGWPTQVVLDFIRVLDATSLVCQGRSRSEIELALHVSDPPGFWIWNDDFVDVTGCHAAQVIRIQLRAREDSRQGIGTACGLALPEGLDLPGSWVPASHRLSAMCHPPKAQHAEECLPATTSAFARTASQGGAGILPAGRQDACPTARPDGNRYCECLFAGECLHRRISSGIARAREALARLLLSDVPLRERLEAQWPYADKHLIAEAIERAVLDYIDHPCRFDAKQWRPLTEFLLLVARRRLADLERTEHRRRQKLQDALLAEDAGEPLLNPRTVERSPAELLVAAEDDAQGERARAQRRRLLTEFRQQQSSRDRHVLDLMLAGERHHRLYAEVLGIADGSEAERRVIVNQAKYRLFRALKRRMLRQWRGRPRDVLV
ncbi:MAG: hypothetical protein ACLQVX_20095 [Limisphaerales bacterium]